VAHRVNVELHGIGAGDIITGDVNTLTVAQVVELPKAMGAQCLVADGYAFVREDEDILCRRCRCPSHYTPEVEVGSRKGW
jgi:hypothetical protein